MWNSNSLISLMMNNSIFMDRLELLVVVTKNATFSAGIAMGAAEDEIDEKYL
jgi:hypothetical protein